MNIRDRQRVRDLEQAFDELEAEVEDLLEEFAESEEEREELRLDEG